MFYSISFNRGIQVLTQTTIDGLDYIFLYVPLGQYFEAELQGPVIKTPAVTGSRTIKARTQGQSIIVTGSPDGISVVKFGSTIVVVADKKTAGGLWQPRLSASYDVSPDTPSVLVIGAYLVRNATVTGSTLQLTGDIDKAASLIVIAPSGLKSLQWNGKQLKMTKSNLGIGLSAQLAEAPTIPALPDLKSAKWKSADSLPEIASDFNDDDWVVAIKNTTVRSSQPFFSGKTVVYADEYGACWR